MSEKLKFDRLQKIRCGGNVTRFHTIPTIRSQNNAAHSWGVAVVCLQLWPNDTDLVKAALYHDCAEYWTGDLPAPIKEASEEIAKTISALEMEFECEHDIVVPLTEGQRARLKFADCLDGAMYCLEELKMGNKMVAKVFSRYVQYLNTMVEDLPEVGWAVKELVTEGAAL